MSVDEIVKRAKSRRIGLLTSEEIAMLGADHERLRLEVERLRHNLKMLQANARCRPTGHWVQVPKDVWNSFLGMPRKERIKRRNPR